MRDALRFAIPAVVAALLTVGCTTTPTRGELELYEALPAGEAAYFGVDVASAENVLTRVVPDAAGLDELSDRLTRVVGSVGPDGTISALAYGTFSQPVARIALRRAGFERAEAPAWASKRNYFAHPDRDLYAVVVGPGVVAVAASPPKAIVEAYAGATRPFGPAGEAATFPVSLVSAADGAVVARFDMGPFFGRGLPAISSRAIALETGVVWMVRSADDLFALEADLWFEDGRGLRAYSALIRLALANWLSTRLALEPERVRGGLGVEARDTSISIELPSLSAEEVARLIRTYLPEQTEESSP